jgi:hypothetical protein
MPPFNTSPDSRKSDENNDKPHNEGRRGFLRRAGQIGVAAAVGVGVFSGAKKLVENKPGEEEINKRFHEQELRFRKIGESMDFFNSLTQEDYSLIKQEITSKKDVTDSEIVECLKKTQAFTHLSHSTAENIASDKDIFGFFRSHRRGFTMVDIQHQRDILSREHSKIEKSFPLYQEKRDLNESRYEVKSTAPTALEISANEKKIRELQEQIMSIEKENERLRQQSAR